MGGYVDKLRPKAGEVIEPGENLLAAIRTAPRGAALAMGIGGVVGMVVADRKAKKAKERQTQGSVAADWPPVRSAVGLTDRRLLVFDYTAMGKPKSLVGQVGLDQVASLVVEKGLSNKLTFEFSDGSAVNLECGKIEKLDDFLTALDSVKPGITRR